MRIFNINNKEMQFNPEAFNQTILQSSRQKHVKIGVVEQSVADKIGVSREALRNWRKGTNGPSDATLIEYAADFLGLSDWTTLFTETNGGKEMCNLSEKQIESVKKIYDACVDVLNHFLYLENVRATLNTYKMRKTIDLDHDVDACISEFSNRMYLVVDKEYFYLRGTDIYDLLAELTIDIANEIVTTLQLYIENEKQVEELFDKLSGVAGRYMQQLNTIVEQNIPKE